MSSTVIDDIRKMTCSSAMRQPYTNLTVLDVYDEAALIGKDFERIIESKLIRLIFFENFRYLFELAYGTETIRDLVPKVIRVLELLESQAAKNEKQMDEFIEMRTRIDRLEMEKSETRELREKYERDVEQIEDQWRKEVANLFPPPKISKNFFFFISQAEGLMAVVSKLEDENRRIRDQLTRNNNSHEKSDLSSPTETVSITREELQCIKNLTEENIRFKRMLKAKEKEFTQKTFDMEAVSTRSIALKFFDEQF